MSTIMIVDDEAAVCKALDRFLTGLGYQVLTAPDGEEALSMLGEQVVDLALVDLVMPKMDGIELIHRMKRLHPDIVPIVLTGFGTITTAVEAMKGGAYHYLTKPFELDDIASLVAKALEHRNLKEENIELRRQVKERYRFENIVGTSDEMMEVFELVDKVADTDSTVLILGESGTGKELIARAIHYNSRRREKPLVTVNCAAIPEELLESELFGHTKGAFTGAVATKPGRFDAADHGTIFLDEIGDMSFKLQVKVLRVLQEQRFEPVGSTKTRQVDVRIITATNQDLEKAVKERRFREDLFYRLNVIPIHLPPLRDRISDIQLLVKHFIDKYATSSGHHISGISDEASTALTGYGWPGNVRELENIIERVVVLKSEGLVEMSDLPPKIRGAAPAVSRPDTVRASRDIEIPDKGMSFKRAVADFESKLIMKALEKTGGNKNKAATLLQLNRTTLVEKIKKKQAGKDGDGITMED
jgi:DNA-binding NtrC family response regulator